MAVSDGGVAGPVWLDALGMTERRPSGAGVLGSLLVRGRPDVVADAPRRGRAPGVVAGAVEDDRTLRPSGEGIGPID